MKAKAVRKMRYWKEWREGGEVKDDDVHVRNTEEEEAVRRVNDAMEPLFLCFADVRQLCLCSKIISISISCKIIHK